LRRRFGLLDGFHEPSIERLVEGDIDLLVIFGYLDHVGFGFSELPTELGLYLALNIGFGLVNGWHVAGLVIGHSFLDQEANAADDKQGC